MPLQLQQGNVQYHWIVATRRVEFRLSGIFITQRSHILKIKIHNFIY